uniref:Uncharacterized protein n=1 Tax=Tanacetum cinerariifolium TaxID=118510 RepID=A0A6L2NCD8_TANCI|nr:hypothetical protein [Tanacetum cinerariifolium]
MMVQAPKEVGDIPTDTQDIPIRTQPSSSQPYRKHKPRRKQREATEVPHTKPQAEKRVPTPYHDPLSSGEDRLQLNELMDICTKLSDIVLSLEQTKTHQATEIEKLKKRVKKLERKKNKRTYGLTRLYKVGLSARVESSEDEEGMGAQEDASKLGRIAKIDANEDLFLIDETAQDQERIKDQDLFGVHNLDGDEVFMDVTTSKDVEQDATVAESVEEWDDVQATIDADRQLDEQIKAQEREQLSIEERSKLLNELIESRRKYFTAKRAEEIKIKPPTKAQQKSLMCTYMKNMEGFKQKDFKGKSFNDIKKISKRVGQELKIESAKKQKLAEQEQAKVADDDSAALKRCLEIFLEDDDDVAIEATPLLLNLLP